MEDASLKVAVEVDNINHPPHYAPGSIECIDCIEQLGWGREFCLGNAMKYLYRCEAKGSYLQDLKKARWYVNRLIEVAERAEEG